MPSKKGPLRSKALRVRTLITPPMALASFSGVTVLMTSRRPAMTEGTMSIGTVRALSSTEPTKAPSMVVRL
ncbi:hypothetical protein D3C87_1401120 [compost metagenome]